MDNPSPEDMDITQPSHQGEVPDWFTTSEESPPVIIPAPVPPADDVPFKLPPDLEAELDAANTSNESYVMDDMDADADDYEDDMDDYEDEEEVEEEALLPPQRPTRRPAPAGTRRRRTAAPPPPPSRGYGCADVITAIFLLLTVLVCSGTILLIANPRSPLNPFPNPTNPALMVIASPLPTNTPTQTFTPLPATLTPTQTSTPTPTATATITMTPTPTQTPVIGGSSGGNDATLPALAPTAGPQFTVAPFPFTVASVKYIANDNDSGCQWQSIAGTVVDMAGKPIKGIAVHLTGSSGNVDEFAYTGDDKGIRYGNGGFEIFVGAITREDQYTVQLLYKTGTPISDAINVKTHTDCKENIVFVSFTQNHAY